MALVSVIGLGYMGLPMAAILAKAGHTVRGVDISQRVVDSVNAGKCPFSEPGMAELVAEAHASGRLSAVTAPEPAEIFILSLPTPVDHETHAPDMSYVASGVTAITPVLKAGDLIVLESTSLVGSTQTYVRDAIETARPELKGKVDYVFCPERAIPGNTLKEMVGNDRLVGGLTPKATQRGIELYKSFCTGALLEASAQEAEMVKLVENASRDAQLAFVNELSMVCHAMGLDVWRVIELASRHPRVKLLKPGTGVGGHCIAVDPWYIVAAAPEFTTLMKTVREVNDSKPFWCVERIKEAAAKTGKPIVTVACLGLAYKPDVDDLRESPSITVVNALKGLANIKLVVVEPHLDIWEMPLTKLDKALAEADVVVSLTAHSVFKDITPDQLAGKQVVDISGIWPFASTLDAVPLNEAA